MKSTHLGCVFQDTEPPKSKSILRKSTQSLGSDRTHSGPHDKFELSLYLVFYVLQLSVKRVDNRSDHCHSPR